MSSNTIVLVIDLQNDFCEGGSLAAIDTQSLINPLNEYLKEVEAKGYLIAFSKDWHKPTHKSLITNGGKWPLHCIAGSIGAELHKDLYIPAVHLMIYKGKDDNVEGHSAFDNTNLESFLKKSNIHKVIICGIAASYCVAQTAISSVKLGYKTAIIKHLTRDILIDKEEINIFWVSIKEQGIYII